MAAKLTCVILFALFAVQNSSALDILGTFKSEIDGLTQIGSKAVQAAEQAVQTVSKEAETVLNNTKVVVESKLQDVISQIKTLVENGPVGTAVKLGHCATTGISSAVAAAGQGLQNVTACVTNEVDAFLVPAHDLIARGQKAISLGSDLYKNLSSCFPNGASSIGLTELLCSVGKIGSLGTEIGNTVTSITNDIQQLQNAVGNVRNSIVRCPRQRLADLVVAFGKIVSQVGSCGSAVNSGSTAATKNCCAQNQIQEASNLVDSVKQGLQDLRVQAASIINATGATMQAKAQEVISQIKRGFADAAKLEQCGTSAITAVGKATFQGIQNATSCITNEVNALVSPVEDLASRAGGVLSLASTLYNNLSSCFPNGYNAIDLTGLLCAVGKIGPLATQIGADVTSITNDAKQIQSAIANARNAIVVCPREKMAALVTEFGKIVTSLGTCGKTAVGGSATNL